MVLCQNTSLSLHLFIPNCQTHTEDFGFNLTMKISFSIFRNFLITYKYLFQFLSGFLVYPTLHYFIQCPFSSTFNLLPILSSSLFSLKQRVFSISFLYVPTFDLIEAKSFSLEASYVETSSNSGMSTILSMKIIADFSQKVILHSPIPSFLCLHQRFFSSPWVDYFSIQCYLFNQMVEEPDTVQCIIFSWLTLGTLSL